MNHHHSENIVRCLLNQFNHRDFDPNGVLTGVPGTLADMATGKTFENANIKYYFQQWLTAFPDCQVEITNLTANGEWVTVEFTARGTHQGPFMGPLGIVAPTGKKVTLKLCEVVRIIPGKGIHSRIYWDMFSLLQQLGALEWTDSSNVTVRQAA